MKNILRIGELLGSKGMTMGELAQKIGTSQDNLYKKINNNPTIKTLRDVANGLQVGIGDLFNQPNKVFGCIIVREPEEKKPKNFVFNDFVDLRKVISKIIRDYGKKIKEFDELSIIDVFEIILEEKGLTFDSYSELLDVKKQNLEKILSQNPSVKTLQKYTDGIDVDVKDLFNTNHEFEITGIIYIESNTYNIFSYNDVLEMHEMTKRIDKNVKIDNKKFKTIRDSVLLDISEKKLDDSSPINLEEIVLDQYEHYDASKVNCWTFCKSGDLRFWEGKKIEMHFGNMINGFPFEFLGFKFMNSECAYIAGAYTLQGEEYTKIQNELSSYSNGLKAKRVYRKSGIAKNMVRTDFYEYNQEWMKLVVWAKCTQSKVFRKQLMEVPDNFIIVEDSTNQPGDTADVWGCKNPTLDLLRVKKAERVRKRLIEEGVTKSPLLEDYQREIYGHINTHGVFSGKNLMGKILTMCLINLRQNTELDIDYDLLNRSNLYWQGQPLRF